MARIDVLREKRTELEGEMRVLASRSTLTRGQEEHFDRARRQFDKVQAELETLERRVAVADTMAERVASGDARMIDGWSESSTPAGYSNSVVRSEALVALDRVAAVADMSERAAVTAEKNINSDEYWAREFEAHSRPEYGTAFQKWLTLGEPQFSYALSDAERGALHDAITARQLTSRAMSETTTQGGFALPVFIDPTVILADQELDNPFLRIASIVDVNTNAWKGVASAGISWSFDAEAAEVSDDSITLSQPTVAVNMARGFIPFSIEVGQDWPGFQSEMAGLLATGYDDLLLNKFTNGSGTGEPTGIQTALTNQTATETVVTTDGAFGQEDIYKVWKALPAKYRRRASWMMPAGTMNHVRQFGQANVYHATTITLVEGAIENLFSRPVYDNAYMTDYSGTTGASNLVIVGDFSQYKIPRRSGMTVELVPHLLNVANNRPSGQRGFFAYARIGGGVVGSTGVGTSCFQILVNT